MKNRDLLLLSLMLLTTALHGCFPAVDRRTSGTYIDDQSIETKVSRRIEEKYNDEIHVDIISFNRFVLLAGEVPDQNIKDDIGAISLGVESVRNVQNEIAIAPVTSNGTRANDAYLTSKVKARFVTENKFQANHVQVITENSVVYLMGLVKHKEADDAAEIASTTGGVERVVKVFEYLD